MRRRPGTRPGRHGPSAWSVAHDQDRPMPEPRRSAESRSTPVLDHMGVPIVLAPMAGGPSTPALAAAVSRAGGLGFLAAGYLRAEQLAEQASTTRAQVSRFGVNVFVGGTEPADPARVQSYAQRLQPEAARAGIDLGQPRFDDDWFDEKIDLLRRDPVSVVSFTFGMPPAASVHQLRSAGSEIWMTVTSPAEARLAAEAGADALIVQGVEAGGHRGVFVDDNDQSDLTLLAALQLVRAEVDLPLIAAGSLMTGAAVAAVLAAGASAAQLGTAFLRTPEAGTSRTRARCDGRPDADGAHACVQRTYGSHHPEPAGRGIWRCGSTRLSRGPPPHRTIAGAWPRRGRSRRGQPVGRPNPSPCRVDPGGRADAAPRR